MDMDDSFGSGGNYNAKAGAQGHRVVDEGMEMVNGVMRYRPKGVAPEKVKGLAASRWA